jgi:hypothetical protein
MRPHAARLDGDALEERFGSVSEPEAQQGITPGDMKAEADARGKLNPLGGTRVSLAGCRERRGMSRKWWWRVTIVMLWYTITGNYKIAGNGEQFFNVCLQAYLRAGFSLCLCAC